MISWKSKFQILVLYFFAKDCFIYINSQCRTSICIRYGAVDLLLEPLKQKHVNPIEGLSLHPDMVIYDLFQCKLVNEITDF